jgi:hypothetical protein
MKSTRKFCVLKEEMLPYCQLYCGLERIPFKLEYRTAPSMSAVNILVGKFESLGADG